MDPLRRAARRDPLGPAVEGIGLGGGPPLAWSWQELDGVVDATALHLAEAGVGPGDAVATLLPPGPEVVALLHALPRVGALLLPLNAGWTLAELRKGLEVVGRPRLLLAPGDRVDELRSGLPRVGTVAVEEVVPGDGEAGAGEGELAASTPTDPTLRQAIPDLHSDTPVAVLLTSGSTGRPRPIPLTHGNLMASARGAADRLRLGPMDRWFASLSPGHVGGLALLHRAAVVGACVVTRPRFDAEEFVELALQGEVSHASLVPVMLRRVLDAAGKGPAPRGLRCVLLGGARTPMPLLEEALRRRWPVALTYGLTEATSQVTTASPDEVREWPGAVGRPLEGVSVRIGAESRSQGTGSEPDFGLESGIGSVPGRIGEILVRGSTVAPLRPWEPGAEGELPPDPPPTVYIDGQGWLHTGDLGWLDEAGVLRVTGRASDRILTGGVTVEPGEVEEVLLEHPAVAEVGVVGLPDPEWGERIAAGVIPSASYPPPDPTMLLDFAGARLASARRPRTLKILKALPRNANGKLDRERLRGLLQS